MIFGARFIYDGTNIDSGFAGYMLHIRLYSGTVLTLSQLDNMIDWDCTAHPQFKLCEFCPGFVGTLNTCLEDDYATGTSNFKYMLAAYNFDSNTVGISRQYYKNLKNLGIGYRFYKGNAPPDVRITDYEPHLSEANGLYFDGNDYIY